MQKIHDEYGDQGVAVLAIHFDDSGEPVEYMKRHGFTYTVFGDGGEVVERMGVSRIPTIMIVDAAGRVAHRQTGFSVSDEPKLMSVIDGLLAARGVGTD